MLQYKTVSSIYTIKLVYTYTIEKEALCRDAQGTTASEKAKTWSRVCRILPCVHIIGEWEKIHTNVLHMQTISTGKHERMATVCRNGGRGGLCFHCMPFILLEVSVSAWGLFITVFQS